MSKGPEALVVFKMLLVGDSNVGKSSLLLRFADDQFSPSFITTIGIDFKIKTLVLPSSGERVRLQIWDTAGQERFRTITHAYYRGAMAIIIVYDVTNKQSFSHLTYWVSEVEERVADRASKPLLAIVGNKCDLAEQRNVGEMEGRQFADSQSSFFIETSAYNGRGVNELFIELAERIQNPEGEKRMVEVVDLLSLPGDDENKKSCC